MRKALIAGAILSSLSLIGTANATDVGTFVATVTISPGLPTTGCANQSVSFSSTATVIVGDHTGTYSFSFSGSSSICESLTTGEGSGTLSGDITGDISYSRSGAHVSMSGTVAYGGDSATLTAVECEFEPSSGNPVTSGGLHCEFVSS